jgi:hypothetical protein
MNPNPIIKCTKCTKAATVYTRERALCSDCARAEIPIQQKRAGK